MDVVCGKIYRYFFFNHSRKVGVGCDGDDNGVAVDGINSGGGDPLDREIRLSTVILTACLP